MITKEEFIDLILKQQEWSNRIDEVSEALSVPTLFESDWVEYASVLFDKTLDLLFNEDGVDDIDWWMYENLETQNSRCGMKMERKFLQIQ